MLLQYVHMYIVHELKCCDLTIYLPQRERITMEQINWKLESDYFHPVFNTFNREKAIEEEQEIFEAYFKHLLSQSFHVPKIQAIKNRIARSLPAVYQRDLEESFHSVVTLMSEEGVAMETSTSHKSHSESPAVHSPTSHCSGMPVSVQVHIHYMYCS